jgi:hypothetical protein
VKREAGRRKRSNLPTKSARKNFHKRTGRKRRTIFTREQEEKEEMIYIREAREE